MFEGILPAIITPFRRNLAMDLDLEGLASNIEFLIENGVHGIVPCGSTGESATLSFEEHEEVIAATIETVNGRVPVIAGTGSNNTAEAVRFTKAAKDLGADGVLVISPYYNKPNRSGPSNTTPFWPTLISRLSCTMSPGGRARILPRILLSNSPDIQVLSG